MPVFTTDDAKARRTWLLPTFYKHSPRRAYTSDNADVPFFGRDHKREVTPFQSAASYTRYARQLQ